MDTTHTITHANAIKCLETAIQWAENNNIDFSEIIVLKRIHEKAVLRSITSKKVQAKITSYFLHNI